MYAVVEYDGQQYQMTPGKELKLPLQDAEAGSALTFDRVLLISSDTGVTVGRPAVEGATVAGTVVRHGRDPKVIGFKQKRRKGYRRKWGHRQGYTLVRIDAIGPVTAGSEVAARPATKADDAPTTITTPHQEDSVSS